jgi:methionyl aminopeptidase
MIVLKSPQEIEKMRRSGRVVANLLEELSRRAVPGVTTGELDRFAQDFIGRQKAQPAFLGYHGFPASICASVNEQVVHGIPGNRVLVEGDLLSLDAGAVLDGYVGDAARTVPIGKVSAEARKLLEVTKRCLELGIEQARDGNHLGDIGYAVQTHAEANGFSVVRDFVGHGIGQAMHEAPQIPNYGRKGSGLRLKTGMTLAIEPMVNRGSWEVAVLSDQWTVVTADGSLSAHFEDTIAITESGPVVMTAA